MLQLQRDVHICVFCVRACMAQPDVSMVELHHAATHLLASVLQASVQAACWKKRALQNDQQNDDPTSTLAM